MVSLGRLSIKSGKTCTIRSFHASGRICRSDRHNLPVLGQKKRIGIVTQPLEQRHDPGRLEKTIGVASVTGSPVAAYGNVAVLTQDIDIVPGCPLAALAHVRKGFHQIRTFAGVIAGAKEKGVEMARPDPHLLIHVNETGIELIRHSQKIIRNKMSKSEKLLPYKTIYHILTLHLFQ